jgi:hypothetical protein
MKERSLNKHNFSEKSNNQNRFFVQKSWSYFHDFLIIVAPEEQKETMQEYSVIILIASVRD